MAQTELGLKIWKQIDITVPPLAAEISTVAESAIGKIENITEEVEIKKKEIPGKIKEFAQQFNNSYPYFLQPLPQKVIFDFDLNLSSYAYISPIANDTDGDKIIMEFKGIEQYNFIVMRQKLDNSFLLVVEETLIDPSLFGEYSVTVLLTD